uniref:BAR domain-containing protein n=1 Tax=Knipowitschia caucasica TaxID=637954 RepID=A0AAV2KQ30_KNICA
MHGHFLYDFLQIDVVYNRFPSCFVLVILFLQKVSEKVGGAEGTKLDDDFKEMEKKVDITSRAVLDIMTKTTEYLQPNPGQRRQFPGIKMRTGLQRYVFEDSGRKYEANRGKSQSCSDGGERGEQRSAETQEGSLCLITAWRELRYRTLLFH